MKKILVIQTAFIGDAILATAVLEKLHQTFPQAKIDLLVRKGNESLFNGHPFLNQLLVWDKNQNKYRGLFRLVRKIRKSRYDVLINLQRFLATGLLTVCSGAKRTIGFDKNPLSVFYSERYPHRFGDEHQFIHEIDRNHSLIERFTDNNRTLPKLYPPQDLPTSFFPRGRFITISPGSVWFTKQYPSEKWIGFIDRIEAGTTVVLLGGKKENELCQKIKESSAHPGVIIKAGKLTLLESAALMEKAVMNYTNDSAPTHMASAINAPVTTIFCSTVPSYGFTPLSDDAESVETHLDLACRPCNLHGLKSCPKRHFRCTEFSLELLLNRLK